MGGKRPKRALLAIAALFGLAFLGSAAIAQEPKVLVLPSSQTVAPGDIVSFSVHAQGIDLPGLASYVLQFDIGGPGAALLNGSPVVNKVTATSALSCAAELNLTGAGGVDNGDDVSLSSSQGAMISNGIGAGQLFCPLNGATSGTSADYICGIGGSLDDVTPQTGTGAIIDFTCYVGESIADNSV